MNESGLAQPRVSRVLVERYIAKIRKRRRWRRLAITVTGSLLVLAAVFYYVAWHTRVLDVRATDVRGTRALTAAQVLAAAKVPPHQPLAAVDTRAVKARVAAIPRVASVTVSRDWPHTVQIDVVERVPAAAVPDPADIGGYLLVDADGVAFDTVASLRTVPPHVPEIQYQQPPASTPPTPPAASTPQYADASSASAARTRAVVITGALAALKALPPTVRARVGSVAATGPYGITLTLSGTSTKIPNVTVNWGGGDQADIKARVLTVLLKQGAAHYDVSAPQAPAYS